MVAFLAVVQTVLLAAHFFVYETWIYFWQPARAGWDGRHNRRKLGADFQIFWNWPRPQSFVLTFNFTPTALPLLSKTTPALSNGDEWL